MTQASHAQSIQTLVSTHNYAPPPNVDCHDLDTFDFGGLSNDDIEETHPAIIEGPCTGLLVNQCDPNLKNVSHRNEVSLCAPSHSKPNVCLYPSLWRSNQEAKIYTEVNHKLCPRWVRSSFFSCLTYVFSLASQIEGNEGNSQAEFTQWTGICQPWPTGWTTLQHLPAMPQWYMLDPYISSKADPCPLYLHPAIHWKLFNKCLISLLQMFHTRCARRIVLWRQYTPFDPYHANSHWCSLVGL